MKKTALSIWRFLYAPVKAMALVFRKIIALFKFPFRKIRFFFTDTSQSNNSPIGDALDTAVKHPGSLLTHLEALRKHLFRSVGGIILFSVIAFYFINPIMQFLTKPLPGGLDTLTAIDITENLGAVMKVSLLCGFAVAIPYLAFETYLFFAPALAPKSRISGLLIIPFALLFFVAGMAFAYYIMLPIAIPFLFDFMGLTTQPRPSSYFNFVTAILFWIGLFFEFPLIAYLLARMGILTSGNLKSHWRLAIIIMAILAATITPTVDPLNMALVMGPMIVLYIAAIIFTAAAQKRRNRAPSTNI